MSKPCWTSGLTYARGASGPCLQDAEGSCLLDSATVDKACLTCFSQHVFRYKPPMPGPGCLWSGCGQGLISPRGNRAWQCGWLKSSHQVGRAARSSSYSLLPMGWKQGSKIPNWVEMEIPHVMALQSSGLKTGDLTGAVALGICIH